MSFQTVTRAEHTQVIIRDLQSADKNNAQQRVPPNLPLEVLLQRMHTFERSFPQTTLHILSTPPISVSDHSYTTESKMSH